MKPGCITEFVWYLSLMTVIAAWGCTSENKMVTDAIESVHDSTWRLDQLDGQPIPVESPAITMQLLKEVKKGKVTEPSRVAGSTGVNQYSGTYLSDRPGSIKFGPLAVTRRAGPPEAMQREGRFLADIERVTSYRLHGDMMSMGDGNATLLVWRR